jgi:hypothetical protein
MQAALSVVCAKSAAITPYCAVTPPPPASRLCGSVTLATFTAFAFKHMLLQREEVERFTGFDYVRLLRLTAGSRRTRQEKGLSDLKYPLPGFQP